MTIAALVAMLAAATARSLHEPDRPAARPATVTPAQPAAPASAGRPLGVREAVLDNGFRVLVVEDRRVPRVAARLWYRFGSMQEPNGEHGSAHFLEHVIHQGTTTVGTTDFEAERPILAEIHQTEQQLLAQTNAQRNALRERRVFYDDTELPSTPEIEALRRKLYELEDRDSQFRDFWAEFNWYRRYGTIGYVDPVPASTEQEYLKIDIDLPKENLELFFRLEADRMVNAVLRGWESQRFTVLEQILNGLSRPEIAFNNALDGATAQVHPVFIPDGGHPRDFAFYNRAAMLRMYDEYFVPNNATLVLVGDITLEAARPLAEQYFGRVPRGPEAPARLDMEGEPVPRGTIRLDWAEPLDPRVVVRYRIPGVGHPDRPIFDTIAAIMRGHSGVVQGRLTRQAAPAASVDADFRVIHTYRFGSPGAINFTVLGSRDEDLPALERAVLDSITDLRDGRVADATLARAHKALRLEWEQIRLDRARLALELGQFAIMDRWETLEAYMKVRQSASVTDVQRVAREYFTPGNLVVATARSAPPGTAQARRPETNP
jgi:predicted Zn-dependent peptidase